MYYPLSQIVTNLYTSNGEFILKLDSSPYTGYYWKNSKGQFFTGKTPQDSPTLELIMVQQTLDSFGDQVDEVITNNKPLIVIDDFLEENEIYTKLKGVDILQETYIPIYMPNPPTVKDYQIGEFKRYFCKKINAIIYIEIDKDQFDLLKNKDNKIAFEFYQPFSISWRITGDKTYTAEVNFNMVKLAMFKQKLPMFDKYIKEDYLKYYI